MQELAPGDRPREKLDRYGPTGLGDNELVAVIVGHGSQRRNVMTVARDVLAAAQANVEARDSPIGRFAATRELSTLPEGIQRKIRGNVHPLIRTPVGDDAAREKAQEAFEEMLLAAIEMGGTVTGEHGVGLLKRGGMRQELSPEVLAMQQAVKQTLDPLNLFNPGKVTGIP